MKYRTLSLDGKEMIGRGANGAVYKINERQVVKIRRDPFALPELKEDLEKARLALEHHIPTAVPFDIVRVGEYYGAVYELVDAVSFASVLLSSPERFDELVNVSTDLLKQIHAIAVKEGDVPDIRVRLRSTIRFLKDYLPAKTWEKTTDLIERVPLDLHLIHGDYHLKNMLMENDKAVLIDMDTLSVGHPVFELSAMHKAYVCYGETDPENVHHFLGVPYDVSKRFFAASLDRYLGHPDEQTRLAVEDKVRLLSYARTLRTWALENALSDAEKEVRIAHCRDEIVALSDRIDSLLF